MLSYFVMNKDIYLPRKNSLRIKSYCCVAIMSNVWTLAPLTRMTGKRRGNAGCILTTIIKIIFALPFLALSSCEVHNCITSKNGDLIPPPHDYCIFFRAERLLSCNYNAMEKIGQSRNFLRNCSCFSSLWIPPVVL